MQDSMQDRAAWQDAAAGAREGAGRQGRPLGKARPIPSTLGASPGGPAEGVGAGVSAAAGSSAPGRDAGGRDGVVATDRPVSAGRTAERHGGPRPGSAPRPAGSDNGLALGRRILEHAVQVGSAGRSVRSLERDAIVSALNGRVRVVVPHTFMAEYVKRNFALALRQAAAEVLRPEGGLEVPVEVVVDESAFQREAGAPERAPEVHGAARVRAPAPAARRGPGATLRHRLGEFVVGNCNRIAYTAACAVAEGTAPPRFSPMFLHGPSGVGKTHLLQGLAARAAERLGERGPAGTGGRVRYTNAEAFTAEFMHAIRSNSKEAFRRQFRDVEVLCIDDIHILAGKGATQAEFLHLFDTLGLSGRMVVLASDEAPRDIRNLSEALASRFLAGACIRIEPPDDATRLELIRRLSAARGLGLDEDAVALVADRAGRPLPGGSIPSVREIEGLLTRVEAMKKFASPGEGEGAGGVVGRSLVSRALGLGSGDGRGPRRPVPSGVIIDRVCRALRVDASDLMGRGRHTRVVLARALVTYLCRRLTTMSYPEIARSMARPNHSTVITAFNRVKGQMAEGKMVEGGPDLAEVTIQSLAERLEREIVQG